MARFSDMLLSRRRQLGMSVQQVANVIKIRPQIIEYFETGDFAQMPPRGYAQGMISSYARYLGLNPREVIDAYFDDLYAFEQSTRTPAGRFQSAVMETTPRAGSGYRLSSSPLAGSRAAGRPPQAGYVSDYEATHGSETTRSLPRASLDRAASQRRAGGNRRRVYGGRTRDTGSAGRPSSARNTGGHRDDARQARRDGGRHATGRRPAPSWGASADITLDPRLLIGGGAVILVLLIVLIALAVRGCTASSAPEEDTPTLSHLSETAESASSAAQAAGTEDADGSAQQNDEGGNAVADGENAEAGENGEDAEATGGDSVPKETVISVSVDKGASVWMEITVDGSSVYAAQTEGPFTQEYRPTKSFDIRVDQSDAVTVTENGEELTFDRKSAGVSRISVDVPQPTPSEDENASGDSADGASQDETSTGGASGGQASGESGAQE